MLNDYFRVWDTPGLAVVVIEGSNRDMGTTYALLNEVLVPSIQSDRILVLINQADMAMKGRHWDHVNRRPDPVLLDFLDQQNSLPPVNVLRDRLFEF